VDTRASTVTFINITFSILYIIHLINIYLIACTMYIYTVRVEYVGGVLGCSVRMLCVDVVLPRIVTVGCLCCVLGMSHELLGGGLLLDFIPP
jgi:hypothetical protein